MIKSANKSFFIIEKMKKYRKCPALDSLYVCVSLIYTTYLLNDISIKLPTDHLDVPQACGLCWSGLPGLAFSRPKNDKFGLFCIDWPRNCLNLLSIWPFLSP